MRSALRTSKIQKTGLRAEVLKISDFKNQNLPATSINFHLSKIIVKYCHLYYPTNLNCLLPLGISKPKKSEAFSLSLSIGAALKKDGAGRFHIRDYCQLVRVCATNCVGLECFEECRRFTSFEGYRPSCWFKDCRQDVRNPFVLIVQVKCESRHL